MDFLDDDEQKSYMEEQEEKKGRESLIKWIVPIALLELLLFATQRDKTFTFNAFWFYTFVVIAGIIMIKTTELSWKYKSPQVVFGPLHFSTNGKIYETTSEFRVIPLGGIRYDFMDLPGKEGTAIIPEQAINAKGDNIVLTVLPMPSAIYEIPKPAREMIEIYNLSPPYYVGYADPLKYKEHLEAAMTREARETNPDAPKVKVDWDAEIGSNILSELNLQLKTPSVGYLVNLITYLIRENYDLRKLAGMKYSDLGRHADFIESVKGKGRIFRNLGQNKEEY